MMFALEGEEGGMLKADAVRELSKGGCVKMQTRGGSKNIQKLCRHQMYMPPLNDNRVSDLGKDQIMLS